MEEERSRVHLEYRRIRPKTKRSAAATVVLAIVAGVGLLVACFGALTMLLSHNLDINVPEQQAMLWRGLLIFGTGLVPTAAGIGLLVRQEQKVKRRAQASPEQSDDY